MFISFEGIDSSGKGSQIQMLKDYFKNKKVWTTVEPSNSPIGSFIREIQTGKLIENPEEATMLYLYMADRSEHQKEIKKHLDNNEIVICDRYLDSSEAYQDFYNTHPTASYLNFDFIKPDITFILDIPVEEAMKRIVSRGKPIEIFEKKEFLIEVREKYKNIVEKNLDRRNVYLINGIGTKEEVFERIKEILKDRI